MGEKLVSLRKIKDLEEEGFWTWDFFDTFKKFRGFFDIF